ncbi:nuclear transport factor 2 family protein [Pseudohalioglobus lutimaris]|uniref:Nuclear transport factor 2 family protein n=1 Tax=Pseudohalioglobus lutimaris TaxID=1737061 RepID=A0A2N5X378_9GAMM|nr:nuclear transport factor 2 family protein [Pseudohalioglobus lutimaris]PLW68951.1 nuclear transport factor 2 family protein [Pseudohalioglobus lutimaris]
MNQVEENKRRTRVFFDALQRADADAIADTYCDDGRVITMGNTLISGSRSKEETREFAAGVLDAFPEGLTFTILNMTAEDDRVAVEATSTGRHVSGLTYSNHYHFLFTWRQSQLLELKEFLDTEVVTEVLCGGARP